MPLTHNDLNQGEANMRALIAKHEAGLLTARSPRARLGHSFRLALAREMLKAIDEERAAQ